MRDACILGFTFPWRVRSKPPTRSILNLSVSCIIWASTTKIFISQLPKDTRFLMCVPNTWYGSRNPKVSSLSAREKASDPRKRWIRWTTVHTSFWSIFDTALIFSLSSWNFVGVLGHLKYVNPGSGSAKLAQWLKLVRKLNGLSRVTPEKNVCSRAFQLSKIDLKKSVIY